MKFAGGTPQKIAPPNPVFSFKKTGVCGAPAFGVLPANFTMQIPFFQNSFPFLERREDVQHFGYVGKDALPCPSYKQVYLNDCEAEATKIFFSEGRRFANRMADAPGVRKRWKNKKSSLLLRSSYVLQKLSPTNRTPSIGNRQSKTGTTQGFAVFRIRQRRRFARIRPRRFSASEDRRFANRMADAPGVRKTCKKIFPILA